MGAGAVVPLIGSSLVFLGGPASAAITPTANAETIAGALAVPGTVLDGAAFVAVAGAQANGVADSTLSSFPTNGPTLGILTSGSAASADDPNTNDPDTSSELDDKTTNLGGGAVRGNSDRDVSIMRVDFDVPATANCVSFDFQFLTEEYADFVGGAYNDAFIAELDTSTWTTSGSSISAPDNFAFDQDGDAVSVNAVGIGGFSRDNAGNTTYDGATPLLSAATQVAPGAHSLYLSIFDQGDNILDSAAFVDNLRVGFVPEPETQCAPGAQVTQFQLDLEPATATLETGQTHTVTATLRDLNATPPGLPGGSVLFETTGVNTATGSDVTDSNGEATFSYVGSAVGNDTISACYDIGDDGSCDASDPSASAQATWENAPPVNDAAGPYAGNEGSAVAISGVAGDVNGDPMTHAWSYTTLSGVDAGASCVFADASNLSTTVTCDDDDGTYQLSLSTDDGVNPPVTDQATLALVNVHPEIGTLTTPEEPADTGTSVALDASYSDAGENDTHSASVDWGDGTTSSPVASGGTVADNHTYAAAGLYTICLTVTDDDGGADEVCSAEYVVVYDPDAGFVTGGGWVEAAPGSLPADPSVSGPVRFGLVSKYKKGATVPTGNTQFQLHAGDVRFHAPSYDWLVVAGDTATYGGQGSVNGEGGNSFLVSVVDGRSTGGPDRFRMKIWDGSGDVVFDNQMGAPDGAAAALERGSIVIHRSPSCRDSGPRTWAIGSPGRSLGECERVEGSIPPQWCRHHGHNPVCAG